MPPPVRSLRRTDDDDDRTTGLCGSSDRRPDRPLRRASSPAPRPPASETWSGTHGVAQAILGLFGACRFTLPAARFTVPRDILQRYGAFPADVRARMPPHPGVRAALAELRRTSRATIALAARARFERDPARDVAGAATGRAGAGDACPHGPGRFDPSPYELPAWRRQWLIWRAAAGATDFQHCAKTRNGRAGCGGRRRCAGPRRARARLK